MILRAIKPQILIRIHALQRRMSRVVAEPGRQLANSQLPLPMRSKRNFIGPIYSCNCESENLECYLGQLVNLNRFERQVFLDHTLQNFLLSYCKNDGELDETFYQVSRFVSSRCEKDILEETETVNLPNYLKQYSQSVDSLITSSSSESLSESNSGLINTGWVGVIYNVSNGMQIYCEDASLSVLGYQFNCTSNIKTLSSAEESASAEEANLSLSNTSRLIKRQYIEKVLNTTRRSKKEYEESPGFFYIRILRIGEDWDSASCRKEMVRNFTDSVGFLAYDCDNSKSAEEDLTADFNILKATEQCFLKAHSCIPKNVPFQMGAYTTATAYIPNCIYSSIEEAHQKTKKCSNQMIYKISSDLDQNSEWFLISSNNNFNRFKPFKLRLH